MEKIRIQKLLSDAGYCSRRKAEAWMAAGKVKVNGHPVKPGDKATYADRITVNDEVVHLPRRKIKRYIMLYKPRGYVTTTSDELDRRCVMTYWRMWKNVYIQSAGWIRIPKVCCC